MCKNCVISLVATYFSVYFLITALIRPVLNVWVYSLIITILICISIMACPIHNGGFKCMPVKSAKKAVKRK